MVEINLNTADAETSLVPLSELPSPIVTNPLERQWVRLAVIRQLFRLFQDRLSHPLKAIREIRHLKQKFKNAQGDKMLAKVTKVNRRYFWKIGAPGFPSEALRAMQGREVDALLSGQPFAGLRTLFLAITKKCSLQCEHCFEWDNLNQQEKLTDDQLIDLVKKYQNYGTTQVMLSGGEPMLRLDSIFKILENANRGTDFWIFTSGLGLTEKNTKQLKQKGLTGVLISLDHFDPDLHNKFRGHKKAFQWVVEGARNAKKAGLVVTLSLCATKPFVNQGNLDQYMELAKRLGVAFVQFIDVRASGRYSGQEVELSDSQIELLESFYLKYNNDPQFRKFPIISYLGYHQRRMGCFGGGNRFFYIDTDGDAHLCPFCTGKTCSALEFSAEDAIDLLRQGSCHAFEGSIF
jgi:MoaA/NifB/PqqE/SkfB family radical SAM enzyme